MPFDSYHARHTENAATPDLLVAGFVEDIQTQIDDEFPLLNESNLHLFRSGNIPVGSISLTENTPGNHLAEMLIKAADPHDIVISHHALKHEEALAAMAVLAEGAGNGDIYIRPFQYMFDKTKPCIRYELTRPGIFSIEWPEALIEAGWLVGKNQTDMIKGLRFVATESGYDVAMLAAAYLDLEPEIVLNQVFNPQALPPKDHGKIDLPRAKRKNDSVTYCRLKSSINRENNPHNLSLNTHPFAYEQARGILKAWGSNPHNLMKFNVDVMGTALAIIPSLMERAYSIAPRYFRDPKLSEAIQPYRQRVPTHILTGYVKWDFKTMELSRSISVPKQASDESRIFDIEDEID